MFPSCNNQNQSENALGVSQFDFNLKSDFEELTSRMTTFDTVYISTDLSVCTMDRQEKIQITKLNDSIQVQLYIEDVEFGNQNQIVKISQNNNTWNIGNFLSESRNRLKPPNADSYPRMIISSKDDTIKLYTAGLADINNFIGKYYKLMYDIDSTNEFYKNAFKQDSAISTVETNRIETQYEREIIIQKILDLPRLQPYYHIELKERLPIKLLENEYVDKNLSLNKFGQNVEILSRQKIDEDSITDYLSISHLNFSNDTLNFGFVYPIEGLGVSGRMIRTNTDWKVVEQQFVLE